VAQPHEPGVRFIRLLYSVTFTSKYLDKAKAQRSKNALWKSSGMLRSFEVLNVKRRKMNAFPKIKILGFSVNPM